MTELGHDTELSAASRARVATAEPGGDWIKPRHGRGWLRPYPKGTQGRTGKPAGYYATQQLAREHALDAVRALVERLSDPDGAVALAAANSLLTWAFGKPGEQKLDGEQQAKIDLSKLTDEELSILVRVAENDRLGVADQPKANAPEAIDGAAGQ
jgi:hypothetical protein